MVEIEKPGNEDLGISLAPCHEVKTGQNAFFINHIRQGSIGDRCGALFVGDRVEAIDDIHVEDLTLQEAMHRLKHNGLDSVRLQIVPNAIMDVEKQSRTGAGRSRDLGRMQPQQPFAQLLLQDQQQQQQQLAPWPAASPTISRHRSRSKGHTGPAEGSTEAACVCEHELRYPGLDEYRTGPDNHISGNVTSEWNPELKHRSIAKSLNWVYGNSSRRREQTKALFESGVIQEGDRVITMNGQSTLNRTIEELTMEFLRPDPHRSRAPLSLTLVTQYSVADTVVPSSGVFDVKLVRRAANLGINLQGMCCVIETE
ncbi:unnamed protein product [Echinostoma caproni]|uniref:PDZ domain-containing protein n=1 Tax=Echinostoma caproni TaxID=27848 RepID=A0A183ADV0_9TREM|nr:unnamed protein product [Echinostoma caproni]